MATFVWWVSYDQNRGKWVVQDDSGQVVSTHRKKSAAVSKATRQAKRWANNYPNDRVEVSIHKKNGQHQRDKVFNKDAPDTW